MLKILQSLLVIHGGWQIGKKYPEDFWIYILEWHELDTDNIVGGPRSRILEITKWLADHHCSLKRATLQIYK